MVQPAAQYRAVLTEGVQGEMMDNKQMLRVMTVLLIGIVVSTLVNADEPATPAPEEERAGLLQALIDNLEVIGDFVISQSEEAIARIKSAITFEDENVEQFLSGPAKTGKAIAIITSSDKVITAVKQNPKLNKGAIALVRYTNLERLNVCEKIGQLKEQSKQEMNCDYNRGKKMHVIKMDVTNDLWPSMTQKLQMH